MNSALQDIQIGLRQGRYVNEASVSTGVVLRILAQIGWNTFDPAQVAPEYTVAGQRVDFALVAHGQPRVFVEVKRPGKGADAEYQLFQYAFHKGVQMVVLTTGQEWSFFLPAEPGDYADRRVYLLDLLERDTATSAERLIRYLSHERILSGAAFADWRNDYRDKTNRSLAVAALPEAWGELVDQEDPTLVELVSEKVEALSGYRPAIEDVTAFLRRPSSGVRTDASRVQAGNVMPKSKAADIEEQARNSEPNVGFRVGETWRAAKRGREVLIGVFTALHESDPEFLTRYVARFADGKHRPTIGRTRAELYPRNPAFADRYPNDSREFVPGWYIDLNMSNNQTERAIRRACEVAGLTFGTEVEIALPKR